MSSSKQTDPLLEWNRLNKENAEQNLVSAIFKSGARTSPIVDKFSMWLLAGTGATGALLITQIDVVLLRLTPTGFRLGMGFLLLSAILGFVAKYKSLQCQIQTEVQEKITELMPIILDKHKEDETKIREYAEQRGLEIETDINFQNVIAEFVKPFPSWVKWLIERQVRKSQNNRQAGYHIAIMAYFGQLRYTFWQAVLFLAFLCAGAWYASP